MENVIVTGGMGFIGKYLVKKLRKNSNVVKIADKLQHPYVDLTNYAQTKEYILKNKPSTIFHLATLPLNVSLKEPYYVVDSISKMSLNLCELCKEGYFKTLIQVSSSEVYGNGKFFPMKENHLLEPRTPYAAGKASADMIALSYYNTFDIDVRIARPFNAYGPGQDLGAIIPATIKHILKGESPIIAGTGEQTRDFIYVTDIVTGLIKIWQEPKAKGQIINIAKGYEIRIDLLVDTIADIMNYKKPTIHIPIRTGDVQQHWANTDLATELLGFKAQISIVEGLRRTVEWWKKQNSI